MSRPPSATDNTWSGPLVTPDASAQYDCSEAPPDLPRDQQRRHNDARSQLIHQEAQQVPSPSRAESPTAHQWAKPASTFPLKRPTAAPVERLSRPDRSHSPQLSERDSIFATHYLPSETDPASTPRLSPSEDTRHEPPACLSPLLEDVSASASSDSPDKVFPRSNCVGTSHMEVDVRRKHPLDSPSLLPPAIPHSTPLLPVDSDVIVDEQSGLAHRSAAIPAWESFQPLRKVSSDVAANKPAALADHLAHRSLLSASLNDAALPPLPPLHSSLSSPGIHSPATSGDAAHQPWSKSHMHEGARENRLERSSSRSRRGRVEQSIEANLTNAEPASHVRSRKSSHYLGLFKENTTSPDRKRREERAGRHDDSADHPDAHHLVTQSEPRFAREHCDSPLELPSPLEDGELRSAKSLTQLSLSDAPLILPSIEGDNGQTRHGDNVIKPQPRALPRSLLEEIRNFHLTPGGARGTSFSRSIPTQFAERGRDYFSKDHASGILGSHLSTSDSDREQPRPLDEEEEQISSAVYFPHERVTIAEEVDSISSYPDTDHGVAPIDISTAQNGHVRMPQRHVSDEPEGNHVDISLRSKNDSRILHGDLQSVPNAPLEEHNEESFASIPERTTDYYSTESEFASADDSGMSVRDEESSLTDEADVTPTATPTQGPRFPRARRKHVNAAPLGAVELKPYRHQVGGHTTVFRFSRRAVCKQLNNRENEFYERIERRHPEMLMFLPRYIGVLNVTFSKTPKRPKDPIQTNGEHRDANHAASHPNPADSRDTTGASSSYPSNNTEQPRIFSQKQVTGIIPQVILENNRHIIPADLFSYCQRPKTADGSMTQRRFSTGIESMSSRPNGHECSADGQLSPQALKKKQWGATTVNRQLQEQVLREVFSPPAIHHRRHARGHLNLPRTSSDSVRRRVNLSEDRTLSRRTASVEDALPQSAGISISKQTNDGPGLSSSASTALEAARNRLEKVRTEETPPRASSLSRTRPMRRRRSGSGLQRRGSLGSGEGGGELLFYDDDGYGGDKEDGVFPMEGDVPIKSPSERRIADEFGPPLPSAKAAATAKSADLPSNGLLGLASRNDDHVPLPSNPKEAQTRKDDRVQFFLLLEDLTAGMNKPCVLDLKMGTRQYGIEADEKKRKSQRRKCQSTTSQQLGVRLCGMQTWNVKKQEYSFEDKYFGRDLKAGREFQDALTRFLYDGASQRSVTKKIPVILEKLAKLENMIRRLKRYRLYASSLLILYDGDPNPAAKASPANSRSGSGTMRDHLQRRSSDDGYPDVQLKIVDFANCVTGEDEISPDAPCPPQHPDDIDRGYLRGLRTLRMYFQRILKEVSHDDYIERGEGEAIALGSRHSEQDESSERYWDDSVLDSDPGEVSF
ncbi:inositol polyphosphate kinase KCS1 [Aspergillus saccharolyticus JOP 1030-1]|uniref:Kinase n=1 Tax=Aspergillus saccharolyticus JOP 1030-1 TaxID=1450539 RepID=A0A318Z9A0_9EURO|nr:SAICAR synthase-like protein [Aspergillus saccharolyticus JOP 1030-1]PYH43789.1 SAICAR synthase-like protein [Aspergillus saccharolyticus JOP 1030-1]